MQTREDKLEDTGGQCPDCRPAAGLALPCCPFLCFSPQWCGFALHSLHCQCSGGCQCPCAKSSGPTSYLLFLGLCSIGQGLSPPASRALPWLVLPLWLLLSGSCAGPSTHPLRSGVSQGSVVGSLEELIRADGFKELRADSQPQHPSRSSEPQFCCLWAHRQLSWPR